MADVNGDGYLDIYVCQVNYRTQQGHNLLYINNGDSTFTERSEEFGLDFEGTSTQAAFFDYDRDGDLDLYLLNHSIHSTDSFQPSTARTVDDSRGGDKLYRNDDGEFTEVTREAGLYSSALGYGLGVAISDVNKNGFPDIYVGNDFHEDDYLYFNNGDGTFTEGLQRVVGHTSRSSMGNDVADFNNDGLVDILSLDMLPEEIGRYRKSGGPDSEDLRRIKDDFGYSPQYSRNTLQLNRGPDRSGTPLFSEIGLFAGISATDWSWAGLFADLNNDGWNDIYVTNGISQRPNDLDYVDFLSTRENQKILADPDHPDYLDLIHRMPASQATNYAFRNDRNQRFSIQSADWGLAHRGVSNGAAYGDLNNDGALDLVVNNMNESLSVYRNNADALTDHNYLQVRLAGDSKNTTGVGSKVVIQDSGEMLYKEQFPSRGFQSSVPHTLHFGLGPRKQVDSLRVVWPDGRVQRLRKVDANQSVTVRQADATGSFLDKDSSSPDRRFQEVTDQTGVDYTHEENENQELERHPLRPHKLSTQGPALAVSDVTGNGLDDVFLGGAQGQPSELFLQEANGGFRRSRSDRFRQDSDHEDVAAEFFDATGNGYLDLYVVSGGGEFPIGDGRLQDRLYLNDGDGSFSLSSGLLPDTRTDGACVVPTDYDGDGDVDLFVGGRSVPDTYGRSPRSYLLENDGGGQFTDVTDRIAPGLMNAGMVTDATWADVDGDQRSDLVVVGEWMPITILKNTDEKLRDVTADMGLANTNGWWNTVLATDVDGDGTTDLVGGNLGANSVFSPSEEHPLTLLLNDFDDNGSQESVIVESVDDELYTWPRRDELMTQISGLRDVIPTYGTYADATVEDLFDDAELRESDQKRVYTFHSLIVENINNKHFSTHPLPDEAQFSPIQSILSHDFTGNGKQDLLIGDNFFGSDTKQGRYDAGYGLLLVGVGSGDFRPESINDSGFIVRGEVRRMELVRSTGSTLRVLIARNDDSSLIYQTDVAPDS